MIGIGKGSTQCVNRGAALIYVITVSFIASIVISLMVSRYLYQCYSIRNEFRAIQNSYTAESGIKLALHKLKEKNFLWRTGTLNNDIPIIERPFWGKDDRVRISVVDYFGYLKIECEALSLPKKSASVIIAGQIPESLRYNLMLASEKPLVLDPESKIVGRIKLNQSPQYRGGAINAILETEPGLRLPEPIVGSFKNSIIYLKNLLSSPGRFSIELFSPQVFSPENQLPQNMVFVNDAVLIENKSSCALWSTGGITLAATAMVQISGYTSLNGVIIAAVGPINVLGDVRISNSILYSESAIKITGQATISGVFIAPNIEISQSSRLVEPALLYAGPPFSRGVIMVASEEPIQCSILNLCTGNLIIKEPAEVMGFIYSRAPVSLEGRFRGFLYCQGFYEPSSDTTNTNILLGTIEPPDYDCSIPIIFSEIKKFRPLLWTD